MREAIAYKAYEFDAHGVEHNHRYAVRGGGAGRRGDARLPADSELYAQPTTWPGAKLPHTWVTRQGLWVSTLDLAGHGRFAVVTGIGGQPWLDAAAGLAAALEMTITPILIGPGQPVEDPYGTWALLLRETDDGGVLLVRPDLYIAARHQAAPGSAAAAREWLAGALSAVLGLPSPRTGRPDLQRRHERYGAGPARHGLPRPGRLSGQTSSSASIRVSRCRARARLALERSRTR